MPIIVLFNLQFVVEISKYRYRCYTKICTTAEQYTYIYNACVKYELFTFVCKTLYFVYNKYKELV